MLVDAAVFTSMALGPAAEAFGVHEIARYAVVRSATTKPRDILPVEPSGPQSLTLAPSLPPTALASALPVVIPAQPGPIIQPETAAQPSEQVASMRSLRQLAILGSAGVSQYVAAHPDAISSLLASPPAPRDVASWWTTLDSKAKVSLGRGAPELIGNLEGIPVAIRDGANRTMLHSTIDTLDELVSGNAGRSIVENAAQQRKMLQSIVDSLDGSTGHARPARTLLSLDVAGQGRAAIVLGDLATADYVTYLVPGMFFTIENQMGSWAEAADELYEQQLDWLHYFAANPTSSSAQKSVATVAWIGYHTPNLTNVGGIQNADEGRDALASAIKGLQAQRLANEPYVTVIAHSYGSTAALMALTEYDVKVDALALVGSPGSPAKSVHELHVRPGNVFVGEAAWDPIPNSSYFGSDPGAASYGATLMSVSAGTDSLTGTPLLASTGHNEYFSPGTQSMRNFALISIGEGSFVNRADQVGEVSLAKAIGFAK